MTKRNYLFNLVIFCLFSISIVLFGANNAQASSEVTMTLSTEKKEVKAGDNFDVTLKIAGTNQKFTTFESDLSLNNVTVTNLTKGNVTKWLIDPTVASPKFFGGIAGESTEVTVYTLSAKINEPKEASIELKNSAVYWTDGYKVNNVLTSAINLLLRGTSDPAVFALIPTDATPQVIVSTPSAATTQNSSSPASSVPATSASQSSSQSQSIQAGTSKNNSIPTGTSTANSNAVSATTSTPDSSLSAAVERVANSIQKNNSKNLYIILSAVVLVILLLLLLFYILRRKHSQTQPSNTIPATPSNLQYAQPKPEQSYMTQPLENHQYDYAIHHQDSSGTSPVQQNNNEQPPNTFV